MLGRWVVSVMLEWYSFLFFSCIGEIIKLCGKNFNFVVCGVMVSFFLGGDSLKVMVILVFFWSWGYFGFWKMLMWYLFFI